MVVVFVCIILCSHVLFQVDEPILFQRILYPCKDCQESIPHFWMPASNKAYIRLYFCAFFFCLDSKCSHFLKLIPTLQWIPRNVCANLTSRSPSTANQDNFRYVFRVTTRWKMSSKRFVRLRSSGKFLACRSTARILKIRLEPVNLETSTFR